MDKALNYFAIARKAGFLETGEDNCAMAVRTGRAKALFVASDAADNARRRARSLVYNKRKTPLVPLPYTKQQLSDCVGRSGCAMLALTDVGLASAVVSGLAADDPEIYTESADMLAQRSEKAARRRQEARAHQRNIRTGKRRKNK